jgi:hypothetical protein
MKRAESFAAFCVAFACASVFAGCTRVQVTGELGGEPLQVTGTAVAWLDETTYVQEDDGSAPELVDRNTDDTVLFLRFFEAAFDAEADFAALPAGQRQRIFEDIAQGDQLLVEIRRGNVLREDDKVKLVDDVGGLPPEILPYLSSVDVRFGAPALRDARYPETAPRLGSDRKALLEVDTLSPEFGGKLTFEVKEAEGESDLVTGKVTVLFAVELLPERLAECNFSPAGAGVVDPCTLNARVGGLAGAGR